MTCKYCQKPIGLLRSLTDEEYCCKDHKSAHQTGSARTLRDLSELQPDTASSWTINGLRANNQQTGENFWSYTQTALLSLVALGGILFLAIQFSGSDYQGERPEGRFSEWLGSQLSSLLAEEKIDLPRLNFHEEFNKANLSRWTPANNGARWNVHNGLIQPGGLRIWQPTQNLADYRFQFEGSVENSSINWAVRAIDHRNYQASKVTIGSDKSRPSTDLVRFTVIAGKEMRRIRVPLPVRLKQHAFHHYEIRASGDRLMTFVDGKFVDSYVDPRLASGGVGFFSEGRERASIRWVRLSSGREFVDQLRSYFSFGLDLPFFK